MLIMLCFNSKHYDCIASLSSHVDCWSFKEVVSCDNIIANKMKSSDSLGVYEMSCKLIKSLIESIVQPPTFCTNRCIQQGVFLNCLKLSKVCLFFLKGEINNLANYCPTSLIPVLAKIFEYLNFSQVSIYFESSRLLSNCQFGFCKGKSTIDAIDELVWELYNLLKRKGFDWVTFCNLKLRHLIV